MCTKQNGETIVSPTNIAEQVTERFTKEEMEHLKFFFDWQTKEFLTSFGEKAEEVEDLAHYPLTKLRISGAVKALVKCYLFRTEKANLSVVGQVGFFV